jgi:hypothetical protein
MPHPYGYNRSCTIHVLFPEHFFFARQNPNTQTTNSPAPRSAKCLSRNGNKKMDEANSPLSEASDLDRVSELVKHLSPGGNFAWLLESAARLDVVKNRPSALYGDILFGADQIAEFLYGDKKFRRRVYNLVETGSLPSFRLGASICSRKSVLLEWITQQENGVGRRGR